MPGVRWDEAEAQGGQQETVGDDAVLLGCEAGAPGRA